MSSSSALRSKAILLVPGLLLAVLLVGCAGSFNFRVHSTSAEDVGSAFVLFGNEPEFAEAVKSAKSSEIVKLIQPAKLETYLGYSEYELHPSAEGVATWVALSEKRHDKLKVKVDDQGFLSFTVKRGVLKSAPQLAVAVVLRTSDNDFKIRGIDHAELAELDATVTLDLTGESIRRTDS